MSMTMFYITLDPSYKARAAHHRATPHTPILTSVVGVGRGRWSVAGMQRTITISYV